MKKRLPLYISIILFILLSAIILIDGLNRPIFEVVMDPSWERLIPSLEIKAFKKSLSYEGIRFSYKVIDPSDISQETIKELSSCNYVLFSPVISATLENNGIKAGELTKAVTIALEVNSEYEGFDIILPFKDFKVSDYCNKEGFTVLENKDMAEPGDMYFKEGLNYVTDYRFSLAVPSKYLKGTVCPDLSKSIIPLLNCQKGGGVKGELFYGFREVERAIF